MPDNQVTIDPEFRQSPPRSGQSRWLPVAAAAVAAFILGWLLQLPTPDDGSVAATSTSTSTTTSTAATTSTTRPPTTTTSTTLVEMAGLAVPLDEAAPGFTDIITLALSSDVYADQGVDVLRWWPSRASPSRTMSSRDEGAWFAGMDAAGTWYALLDDDNVASAGPVVSHTDDVYWSAPTPEPVALRVADLAWHDTEPGRLAWVSCPRTSGNPGTLNVLDVADPSAEPVLVAPLSNACGGWVDPWIGQWGDWGFVLERVGVADDGSEEVHTWTVLLDPDGVELAELEHGSYGALVGAGPAGAILTEEVNGGGLRSFLVSPDGEQTAVPGIAEAEWVGSAWWSPDGSRIALMPFGIGVDRSSILVVDAAAGKTVDVIDEPGADVGQACWSSDGRFLIYGRDPGGVGSAAAALVVYDTTTGAIAAEVPLPEHHELREIRTAAPADAIQLTPVEWGIDLDDSGSGIHTVSMIVDTGFLTPDAIEDLSGRLIWDETVVDLCGISIREAGDGFLHVGDIFQTIEGCGSYPTAMQDAFDEFGLPETACVSVRSDGLDYECCAPLN